MTKVQWILICLLFLATNSCKSGLISETPLPKLDTIPPQILISEVFAGAEGNNQADFIELYNAGTEIANLKGTTLWYQLNDSGEEIALYSWQAETLIPPQGYFALILEGQLFTVLPDAIFTQPLVPNRGGISLRSGDQILDQLSWGTGPAGMAEGNPALALISGSSLRRLPDPNNNTSGDSNHNLADFSLNPRPDLQNSGSPLNHRLAGKLTFNIDFPYLVRPGEQIEVPFQIDNQSGITLENIQINFPLPTHFSFLDNTSGFQLAGDLLTTTLPTLEVGATYKGTIPLQGAFTFADYSLQNAYLTAENWPLPAFAGPFYGEIGGGAIPVATARELIDQQVVVEGTSTMVVGGFYAGTGAKFYLEDQTGGIQVYVADAGSSLVVPLGSTVRVSGKIEVYRDSLELVPASEDQVEIIQPGSQDSQWAPESLTIQQVEQQAATLPGRLVEIAGQVARIEELLYSYEIDLFDQSGGLVSLFLDKETGITIEEIESDQHLRVTGILEFLDGSLRLYPRLQSDLSRVYPPGLSINAQPPTTANPGDPFPVRYAVINHSSELDHNLVIRAPLDPSLEVLQISSDGRLENDTVIWEINQLAGNGIKLDLEYQAKILGDPEFVSFSNYSVQSDAYPDPSEGIPSYTFGRDSVPIWAIQGAGDRSPYMLATLTTQGVVTGVFSDLEGFWIQEKGTDHEPATSPGLFIHSGPNLPDVSPGDLVSVTGQVREPFQQTELAVSSPVNVVILGREALPAPVALDPPVENEASQDYYETLEGSLVTLPGAALVVGPTTPYGEFAVVLPKHGISRTWQDLDHGMLIHVDDGSNLTHQNRDAMTAAVAVGDTVSQITGPLAFSFGNYKIEPTGAYPVQNQPPALTKLDELAPGTFRIMTWNVENLFDFVVPHPSSPPLPRVSDYKRDLSKVAQTIQAAGFPTVIGFQEVENIGILEDIAYDPLLIAYNYLPILIEGTDSRGIDVGYLVRQDQAALIQQTQYPAPGNITSRPPLLIELQLVEHPGTRLYILNNHFTSMSGGEQATEPRRDAQAAWNVQISQDLLGENLDGYLIVMGDLNSYYGSLPLRTLQEGGLINIFDRLEPGERYTYVYQGISQVLDHILVNEALDRLLQQVDVLHCNADYPLPSSDEESYLHKSDHDPVVATFVVP